MTYEPPMGKWYTCEYMSGEPPMGKWYTCKYMKGEAPMAWVNGIHVQLHDI